MGYISVDNDNDNDSILFDRKYNNYNILYFQIKRLITNWSEDYY